MTRAMPLSKYAMKKRLRLVRERVCEDIGIGQGDLDAMWRHQISVWQKASRHLPQTRAEWLAAELSFLLDLEKKERDTHDRSRAIAYHREMTGA